MEQSLNRQPIQTAAEAEVTETEGEAETAEEAANDEEEKVKVGVSWNADEIDEDAQLYIDAVTKAGGEAIYLPQIKTEDDAKNALAEIDALVMTGGEDIDPSYYGEEPNEKLETVNEVRDTSDSLLIKAALDEDIPMLCTCRGCSLKRIKRRYLISGSSDSESVRYRTSRSGP